MGIATAILGAGGSLLSSNKQANAISDAQQAQTRAQGQAIDFQRDAFNTQVALAEPFRQFGIQQANAMGELFGFNPVGQGGAAPSQAALRGSTALSSGGDQFTRLVQQNPDLEAERRRVNADIGNNRALDINRDGLIDQSEFGRFHNRTFGDRPLPSAGGPSTNPGGVVPGSVIGADGQPATSTGINEDAQARARQRFEGSLFNDVFTEGFDRSRDNIDSALAGQGLAFSGARLDAVEDARANNFLSAVGMFTNALMGQPSTAGAEMGSSAAGQFGANSANLALQGGQTNANAALARGQNQAGLVNNLANVGAFGLGAFGGQGGGGFGAKQIGAVPGAASGIGSQPIPKNVNLGFLG